MRTLLLLSTILIVSSCSTEEKKTVEPAIMSSNNVEPGEWSTSYPSKRIDNAHSGRTVAVIDSATIYSLGYSKSLEDISKTKIDSVVFSYWIFFKDKKATAKTVISIDKPDNTKNLFWAGNPADEKVNEYNKWVHISESFKIPAGLDPKSIMKLYVWNTSKEEILLDDFKVEFY